MSDPKPVHHLTHDEPRANIPSGELEPVMEEADKAPLRTAWERRNRDLDPQLVWRGKDPHQEELTVDAPPIYRQEHVHPKALIDDLRNGKEKASDLFGHFGLTEEDREAEVEFYRHSRKWSNRMILGDGLQVMSSLSEREGLRGQVQAIYIDPPYGIRFNSNFQWSTTSRDVKDGKREHLTREPEQVKAFRDTWRDGIHSYLSYLRDRLTVARELLTESGSCFVQIGDENVHRVRALMDEVFGEGNFVNLIRFKRGGFQTSAFLPETQDSIVWFSKDRDNTKFRRLYKKASRQDAFPGQTIFAEDEAGIYSSIRREDVNENIAKVFRHRAAYSATGSDSSRFSVIYQGKSFLPSGRRGWSTHPVGMERVRMADRFYASGKTLERKMYFEDSPFQYFDANWDDTVSSGFSEEKVYVVQTQTLVVERCLLMTTDPGDLVLDPTCGSGTTATVAEQWGRRWITIDTSRVALALARARIMGAKYPWYLLADSEEGQKKIAQIDRIAPSTHTTHDDIRHGFVYERVPHITLKSIANNAEIDVIWEKMQPAVEAALEKLNDELDGFPCPHPIQTGGRAGKELQFGRAGETELPSGEMAPMGQFLEWEVPREAKTPMAGAIKSNWGQLRQLLRHEEAPQPARGREERGRNREAKAAEILERLNYDAKTRFTTDTIPDEPFLPWPDNAKEAHSEFWQARIARQQEIDASIAAKADHEYLYDKPHEGKKKVRVAGPFTVESLSPHRTQAVDEHGELIDEIDAAHGNRATSEQEAENYYRAIMENLSKAGIHQPDKADAIQFESLTAWEGDWIAAEGRYLEGDEQRRAAIFIGPEYGTVSRPDLVDAAREAAEAGFDILVACAFNFEAHAQELHKIGRLPILHARMNADLHMAGDLKAGGGNLFVVFGEPDIDLIDEGDTLRVDLKGVDVFRPQSGKIESSDAEDIACWFIDTDYSGESFFVRQAYFPGADVPYKQLRSTLKGEIDEEAWESLKRTTSRSFPKPTSGRIAVKVINHLGDEVMKVIGTS